MSSSKNGDLLWAKIKFRAELDEAAQVFRTQLMKAFNKVSESFVPTTEVIVESAKDTYTPGEGLEAQLAESRATAKELLAKLDESDEDLALKTKDAEELEAKLAESQAKEEAAVRWAYAKGACPEQPDDCDDLWIDFAWDEYKKKESK